MFLTKEICSCQNNVNKFILSGVVMMFKNQDLRGHGTRCYSIWWCGNDCSTLILRLSKRKKASLMWYLDSETGWVLRVELL